MCRIVAAGAITCFAINKCSLIKNPVIKKIINAGLGAFGVGTEIQGIFDALEAGDYDLAATRSVQAAMSIASVLFFNCFTGETLVATENGQK